MQDNAGVVLLATSSSTGLVNVLANVDVVVSLLVGCVSIVGILYSIAWHRVRIKQAKRKSNEPRK